MSRVFVATETALDRQVVIKVLPPDLAAGINTDRFRREIQLAARLQHPHIVPLLAAGAQGSLLYYTMPFIGGENLRARLAKTRELPVQEATKFLREIADALSYAHSQGVVHRDIKPENVLISGNHALVTDFGVSKALSSATSETPTDGPTLTSLGMALGTPAYMAPEQAAADPMVDARADIYSLGIVGYELLAGRTPFAGLNSQQTLSAHITTPPAPISQHRPGLPPGLATTIMRCLEKHPSDRWQTADELHSALESYAMSSGATAPAQAIQKKPFSWTPQRVAVAAGILGLVGTVLIASTMASRRGGQAITVTSTKQITNASELEIHPSISPDGQMIAYVAGPPISTRLYVRQISGGRSIALTDSSTVAQWPRWSPDGSKILYTSQNQSFIVPALGGAAAPIQGSKGIVGCSWSNSGDKIACTNLSNGSIVIAGARGENPRMLPGTANGDGSAAPAWSADDRLIAYTQGNIQFFAGELIGNIAPSSIWVARIDGGTPVRVSETTHLNTSPIWTPDGALLYISSLGGSRDIYLQRISSDLKPRGEPQRLTTGLNAHTISIDRSGKKIAYSVLNTVANIWSAPIPAGPVENIQVKPVTTGNQTIEWMTLSPDKQWLVYDSNLNGNQDIYKMPIGGGEPQQLTHNGIDNFAPSWSFNGKMIGFHSIVNGSRDVFVMDSSGANVTPVAATPREELSGVWLPDGNSLLYQILPDSMFIARRDPAQPNEWAAGRFLLRAGFGAIAFKSGTMLVGGQAGVICPGCEGGLYLTALDGSNRRLIPTPAIMKVVQSVGAFIWSPDERYIFLSMREKDGTSSVWRISPGVGEEVRLLRFTDPSRQFYRPALDVDAKNLYFTLGDRQSDIWTLELKKQ